MRESFRLGHIAGIRVGVNWSVVVIFLLVFGGLAAGQFPLLYPELPPLAYAVAGGVAAILFFGSLLLHELAHAVVARRNGVGVDGITLWLFGGVASLKGESPNAGADLRIAGVGPLVSLALAAVFLLGSLLLGEFGVTGITLGVFGWLGVINLALAVFNLAPAAPLDGGRILRALLWMRRGDRTSAAITAARAGRVFGFLLVGLGLLEVIVTPGIGGLWLMLIGWFIANAASAEEQHAKLRRALGGLRVADVMTPEPTTVPPGLMVSRLLDDYVLRQRFSAFPIVDATGRPQGLVTLNRIKRVDPEERATTPVERIACPVDEVPVLDPSQTLNEVLAALRGCADGRALVLDGGRLVGIVSPTDIARVVERAELRGDLDRSHV